MSPQAQPSPELRALIQCVMEEVASTWGGLAPLPVVMQYCLHIGMAIALSDQAWALALMEGNRDPNWEGPPPSPQDFGRRFIAGVEAKAAEMRQQGNARWN